MFAPACRHGCRFDFAAFRRFPVIKSPSCSPTSKTRPARTQRPFAPCVIGAARQALTVALALLLLLPPPTLAQDAPDDERATPTTATGQRLPSGATPPTLPAASNATPIADALQIGQDALHPLPLIKAGSAILMDAVSGQVLWEQNADQPRPMASTTKIMTALLFCERVPNENTIVTASKYASTIRESSLHLKPGEKITAHDLLRAILMRSANDACVDAAEHVAGSVGAFADLMNQRAAQLGCTHTHFTNPNGLNDKTHYTSARDLALIARQAMLEPRISEVTRLRKCRITRSMDKMDVTMRNHSHKFLDKYAGADGVKTGWTIPAGHCFVGSATRGGWQLIAVVLKSPDFVHETCALLDYGYANFAPATLARAGDIRGACPVTGGLTAQVPAITQNPLQIVGRKGDAASLPTLQTRLILPPHAAPIRKGMPIGTLEVTRDGKVLASTPLLAGGDVPAVPPAALLTSANGGRKSLLWLASLFAIGVVSLRYYANKLRKRKTASSKGARRRWRRFTKGLRGAHR